MTTSSPKPRRRHGKFLIALFAATAALAGGGQAAAPAPAAAMTDDGAGTECAPWETEFFNDCTEGSGGSTGGSTGDGGSSGGDGGSSSDGDDGGVGGDGPIVGGEVIRVESTTPEVKQDNGHYCGSARVVCVPPYAPNVGPKGTDDRELQKFLKREIEHLKDAEVKKKRKADEDKKYADCVKETKKYMLPGQRPLCPVYCPVDEKYHTPLDKANGCDVELIPNADAKSLIPWSVYLKGVKGCHRFAARLKNLEDLAARLKAAGSYSDEAWHAHGFESHERLLRTAWGLAGCSDYIAT